MAYHRCPVCQVPLKRVQTDYGPRGWVLDCKCLDARTHRAQYEAVPVVQIDPRLEHSMACPFCGGRNLSMSSRGHYVHCEGCGADGPEIPDRRGDRDDRRRISILSWNQRSEAN